MTAASTPDVTNRSGFLPGFVALAAIWGSSFLFIKVGVAELHPVHLTLFRVGSGGLTLLVVLLLLGHRLPGDLRTWAHLLVIGGVGIALPFTLFGYGEQRIPSLLAGIWNATTPLVALPMATLVFRTERFTGRKAAGIGLGFVGVLVVLGVWQGVEVGALTGQALCFAAAFCYGVIVPYQKRYVIGGSISGLSLAAGQLVTATVLLTPVALLAVGPPPAPSELSAGVIASVLTLGMLGTGLAFLIHMRNLRLVGATAASMVTYLIPVFAVVVGVVILEERLTWHQPLGALIVLVGVAVAQGLGWGRRAGRGGMHRSRTRARTPVAALGPAPVRAVTPALGPGPALPPATSPASLFPASAPPAAPFPALAPPVALFPASASPVAASPASGPPA